MIDIQVFEDADRDEVIKLVLHCQNDGTRPLVGVDDQPELLSVQEKFFKPGGSFWVAKEGGRVAGTIGLVNCGNGIGILKKFFVYEQFRGEPTHLGRKLYAVLIEFARSHGFRELVLDTPKNTKRAHDFYDKAGFVKIEKEALPVVYSYPYEDSDFFLLHLSSSNLTAV